MGRLFHRYMHVTPRFDFLLSFAEGISTVEIGFQWGYIDITGEILIFPCPTMRYLRGRTGAGQNREQLALHHQTGGFISGPHAM